MPQNNQQFPESANTAHGNNYPVLEGYQCFFFKHQDIGHSVYHRGDVSHPPLLIMSELAGFAPGLLMFADRLVQHGYQVYLPWMFGPFGKRAPLRNAVRLCVSREFANLRAGVSAPITTWLRALSTHISERNGNARIGAIGMCLTGAFAIPLIIEPHVVAGVAAQPAAPMSLIYRISGWKMADLGSLNISNADIEAARQRLKTGSAHLLACRFRADRICPAEKLERLRREFPGTIEGHEYGDESTRNVLGHRPHATFTREYRLMDDSAAPNHPSRIAFSDLLAFFAAHLHISQ